MVTPRNFISIIIIVSLIACSHTNINKVLVLFDRVDNLENGSKVFLKGFPIGQVTNLELFGDSVLATLKLADSIKIPLDSKFIIIPALNGSSCITIEPSANALFLSNIDTTNGFYKPISLFDDLDSDSTKQDKILQTFNVMQQGIKAVVEKIRDTTPNKK